MQPITKTLARSVDRRTFLVAAATGLSVGYVGAKGPSPQQSQRKTKKVAAIVTIYTHNSHADVIVGRLLESHTLDGKGTWPPGQPWSGLELASLYIDQPHTPKDKGAKLAQAHGVRLASSIDEALTLGGSRVAVDGVLLIGEHGNYPLSGTGQIMYPRRRFFAETAATFQAHRRVVPVFMDKHLAWNWEDAHWIYDTARRLKIPLMAGSSVPGTWRRPALEMRLGARAQEAVALSYGPLEAYGYHALEALQSLVERRRGGETGVAAVQFVSGADVWRQREQGRFSSRLFEAALERRENKDRFKGPFEEVVKRPIAFFIEYRDGFRATVVHDEHDVSNEWIVAWQERGRENMPATLFWTQEARPLGHFAFLVQGIEKMIMTGRPTWPAERTLLTTGILAALFESKQRNGARVSTPHLKIAYRPTWKWSEPPAPPPGRLFSEQ